MSNIYVRKAQLQDLPAIMKIIDNAKALLKADGSPQWQDGSPE
jgi:N-acetylglutamate synthase-like GNAT family acetyltransferase